MNFTGITVDDESQTVNKVCTPCTKVLNEGNEGEQAKAVTLHIWTKVHPQPSSDNFMDPLNVLKLSKRLVTCTECGSISLTS